MNSILDGCGYLLAALAFIVILFALALVGLFGQGAARTSRSY